MPKIRKKLNRKSHKYWVLRHLEDFKTLTSWEAFESYGITRLSAVIFTLREDGYDIYSDKVSTKNRYGNTVNFSKYYLKD